MSANEKKRFDLSDRWWQRCSYFSPRKLLDSNSRLTMPSLQEFVQAIPRLFCDDIQNLDNEWRSLEYVHMPPELKDTQNIVSFYKKLSGITDCEGNPRFKWLPNLAFLVLSLPRPTSNADAERLFSKVNLIKTDTRNRLHMETMNALIILSEAVKDQGSCCINFKPNDKLMRCIM